MPGSTEVPVLMSHTLWWHAQGSSDCPPPDKELEFEQGLWEDSPTSPETQLGRRKTKC